MFAGALPVALLGACTQASADATKRDTAHSVTSSPSVLDRVVDIDGVPTDTADGDWIVKTQKSEMDDAVTTVLTLHSDHPFVPNRPYLLIQCEHGKPLLFLRTGELFESASGGSGTDVRYRSDDQPPVSERWLELINDRAIFPTNMAHVIRKIAAAKQWRIEYTEFHGGTVVVSFRPAKLNAALRKVSDACHLPT